MNKILKYIEILLILNVVKTFGQDLYSNTITDENKEGELITWCTVSNEEQMKCKNLSLIIEKDVIAGRFGRKHYRFECKQGFNKDECMALLDEGIVHATTLDAGEVFIGGRYHSLIPVAQEIGEGNQQNYYSVAVIKKDTLKDVRTLRDLRNKKACFAGVGIHAGWVIPIQVMMREGGLEVIDCNNHVKSVTNFFGPSCAVNTLADKYNPIGDNSDKLCSLCIGVIPGGRCTSADPYAGFSGAFRCLLEAGDIAFLKHTTVQEMTEANIGLVGVRKNSFELLCRDGSRKSIDDYRNCNWGSVPTNAIVTSSAQGYEKRKVIQAFLKKTVQLYGGAPPVVKYNNTFTTDELERARNRTYTTPDPFGRNNQDRENPFRRPDQDRENPFRRPDQDRQDPFRRPDQDRQDPFRRPDQDREDPFRRPDQDRQDPFRRPDQDRQDPLRRPDQDRQDPFRRPDQDRQDPFRRPDQDRQDPLRRPDQDRQDPFRRPDQDRQDPFRRPDQDRQDPVRRPDQDSQDPFRRTDQDRQDPFRRTDQDRQDPFRRTDQDQFNRQNQFNNPDRGRIRPDQFNRQDQDGNRQDQFNRQNQDRNRQDPFRRQEPSESTTADPFRRFKRQSNDQFWRNDRNEQTGRNIDGRNIDDRNNNNTIGPETNFKLFESAPRYGFRHNLIFQDNSRNFLYLDENKQTYSGYLGNALDAILQVRECPVRRMSLCITSEQELEKCVKMRTALKAQLLKPEMTCFKARSHIHCMQAIRNGDADVAVLDASDVYTAGLRYDLMPFIAEVYNLGLPEYYVVAVSREDDPSTELTYLKGKYTCHTGIYTAAGWVLPLAYLIANGWIRSYGCDSVHSAAEYFGKSCVPGALSVEYNSGVPYDNLCHLCHGTSFRYCRRDASEDYYGHTGAFRCLVEGGGHVAFVKHTTVMENTDGKRREWWARNTLTDDYELLCPDGTRALLPDYQKCNLGKAKANAIVTRGGAGFNETELNAFINLFVYAQQFYGRKDPDDFSYSMYYSAPPNSDLIFQDATQQLLVLPPEERHFRSYLGRDFMKARALVDCHAAAPHIILPTFLIATLTVILRLF